MSIPSYRDKQFLIKVATSFGLTPYREIKTQNDEGGTVGDITREELKGIVFVSAHNSKELSDQVQLLYRCIRSRSISALPPGRFGEERAS